MSDEIIEELWRIKDGMAREHRYDVRELAAYLQSRMHEQSGPAVDLGAANEMDGMGKPIESAAAEERS